MASFLTKADPKIKDIIRAKYGIQNETTNENIFYHFKIWIQCIPGKKDREYKEMMENLYNNMKNNSEKVDPARVKVILCSVIHLYEKNRLKIEELRNKSEEDKEDFLKSCLIDCIKEHQSYASEYVLTTAAFTMCGIMMGAQIGMGVGMVLALVGLVLGGPAGLVAGMLLGGMVGGTIVGALYGHGTGLVLAVQDYQKEKRATEEALVELESSALFSAGKNIDNDNTLSII